MKAASCKQEAVRRGTLPVHAHSELGFSQMRHVFGLCLFFDVVVAFVFAIIIRSALLRAVFIFIVGVALTVVHFVWPFARYGNWHGAAAFAPNLLPWQLAYCLLATGAGITLAAWTQQRKKRS